MRKDGSRFMASVVIDPVRDASGRLIGFAKITRDVTERVERQRSLDQTRAELAQSQKMEAVGQLTGGIAHDFNNLLQVIRAAAQRCSSGSRRRTAEVQRYVEMVKRNVDRAATLTQRLLAFSRRQPLEPKRIDTNRTCARRPSCSGRRSARAIAIETVLGGGVWPMFADPTSSRRRC